MGLNSMRLIAQSFTNSKRTHARTTTAEEMGEKAGVSASTVRNRIERLENAGVIEGYHPHIDYEAANYQLHIFVICRVPSASTLPVVRFERQQRFLRN
jgi:Lrp/AsnC family transcriptional regulator, leucine-responsive regulatory protein